MKKQENRNILKGLRRQRVAVSVFFFIAGFTFSSWASRIPHIQVKLGIGEAALGGILFALPVGLMVSLLIAGGLITRLGTKSILVFGSLSYSTLLMALGWCQTTWQLTGTLFLFGMAANLFNISMNTQAVGVEKEYGKPIMASFHGIWSLAGFSGATFGTLMVAWHVEPWQHFILAAILGVLLAYAFSSGIIASAGGSTPSQTFVLPDKRILKFGLIAFCCLVCEGSMFDWSGVYFNKVVAAPAEKATIGYTAFMASMAAGRFIADRMVWSLGARRVLIGSGILIFAGLSLAVLLPTLLSATLGFALVGFGVSSVVPIVYSMAGRSTQMHPSQALAAVSTVGFAGFLFGPPFIGLMAGATSLQWSFALVACFGLCTSILSASFAAGTGTKPV